VLVPDRVLFGQWYAELAETTGDLGASILRAGSGYTRWRESLRLWTMPGERPRIVLATTRTAASAEFRDALSRGEHLLLVADEVHRLGSPENRNLLQEQLFGPRLGLSATPERAGDPIGTSALLSFFSGVLKPRYTLADAVRDGVLCRYFYRPHVVELTEAENAAYQVLSEQIAVLRARVASGDRTPRLEERIRHLYIKRARIAKQASGKIPLAVSILAAAYERGQRWIVYCDDVAQLTSVSSALLGAGIENMPFHAQMDGDRAETLKWLNIVGGVVVAIKCLDEGVDIPSVTHALILASSKNPREFIQRRGRVLRTAPAKALAYIHDTIVVAPNHGEKREFDPILTGELARAVEFAQHAENPAAAADLQQIAVDAGIDWRTMLSAGVEDDDNEQP
jgi:superfamily II DNA or RNA helicase